MQSLGFENGLNFFAFWSEGERERGGLVFVPKDRMNRFSMYEESDLDREVLRFTRETPLGDSDNNWNTIVEELGLAARYVAAANDANPAIAQRVWANAKTKQIGIATIPELDKPNVNLDEQEIRELLKLNRIKRHHQLAFLIEQKFIKHDTPSSSKRGP